MTATEAMPKPDDRLKIAPIGEFSEDLLTIDARMNASSSAQQASSLLRAKLQEREERIKARVTYLAWKRGISFDQMWEQLLKGTYAKITAEEAAFVREE